MNTEFPEDENKLYSPYEAYDNISLNYLQILAYLSLYLVSMFSTIITNSNSTLVINKYSSDPAEASALNKMTFFYMSTAFITGGLTILVLPPKTENKFLNNFLWTYTVIALLIYYSYDQISYIISIFSFGIVSFTTNMQGVMYLYDILPKKTHFYFFTLRGTDVSLAGLFFVLFIYLFDFNISYFITYGIILLNGLVLFYIFNQESPVKLCLIDKQMAEDSMNLMCDASKESYKFVSYDPDTSFGKFNKTRVFYYQNLDIIYTDLIKENDQYYVISESGKKEIVDYQSIKNESIKKDKFAVFSSELFMKVETYLLLSAAFFQESLGALILNNFQHFIKTYYIFSENTLNLIFIYASVLSLGMYGISAYAANFINKWIILLGSSAILIGSTLAGTFALDYVPNEYINAMIIAMTGLQRWAGGILFFGAVKVQMDYVLPEYKSVMQVMFVLVRCIGLLFISCFIYAMDLDDYYRLLMLLFFGIINISCYLILLCYSYYN